MERRVTSPTWGPPPPCKQALTNDISTTDPKQIMTEIHKFYTNLYDSDLRDRGGLSTGESKQSKQSKHEAFVFEHKQAIALDNEKIEQEREAKERAYAEELALEQKKLDLQQAQKKPTETNAEACNY